MQNPTFTRDVITYDRQGNATPGKIAVTIDIQKLADMLARKAVKNKSKLSKLSAGKIVGKMI